MYTIVYACCIRIHLIIATGCLVFCGFLYTKTNFLMYTFVYAFEMAYLLGFWEKTPGCIRCGSLETKRSYAELGFFYFTATSHGFIVYLFR